MNADTNIVLIGMPGAGKSTVGVLLAKATSRPFLDTDIEIQAAECRRLQEIIDQEGPERFRRIEERHVLMLECMGHVVATGGSVVYSEPAMAHLKSRGVAVFLHLPFEEIERRVANLDERGVAMFPGQTFRQLYEERAPLYRRYADITVDCSGLGHDQAVAAVLERLPQTDETRP